MSARGGAGVQAMVRLAMVVGLISLPSNLVGDFVATNIPVHFSRI